MSISKTKLNVLVLSANSLEDSIEELKNHTHVPVEWTIVDFMDKKRISDLLPKQDILVSTSLDISFKNESINLKAIFMPGAGWEKVSFDAVPHGCLVTNSYEHEIGIAEYVIMSMIALDRNLINVHNNFSKNKWDYWPQRSGSSKELHGRTVSVLGLGRIGKKVLEMTKVFGMKNYAIEVNPVEQSVIEELSLVDLVNPEDMNQVLSISDFFVICVPFIKSTEGLITKKELDVMRNDSFIINPARGPIINQKDLFQSLKSNQIGGAALDTWYRYPKTKDENPDPSDFPFNELNNVIITPHICGSTFGTFDRRMRVVAQNINNFSEGKEPINRVQELSKD
jgi:phosphoglycerate dehydrogenase-like enzyme